MDKRNQHFMSLDAWTAKCSVDAFSLAYTFNLELRTSISEMEMNWQSTKELLEFFSIQSIDKNLYVFSSLFFPP